MDSYADKNIVVCISKLCKQYANGKQVLQNFSMNVERGTIYGFLGSSGCGKTTVLSCVVGLTKWNSGKILVFGKTPGNKESDIASKRLGYMPQELAVCDSLSIRETLQFYGRVFNMTQTEIFEQSNKFTKLLGLPEHDKYIQDLSGGEKRRISLSLALIHSPELLILDEPTVGLDPLLRIKIWDHLFQMVRTKNSTIIITTHYTEEARFANRIGVLRNGRMLIEDSPSRLLEIHNCDLLDQVVLKLCRGDNQEVGIGNSNHITNPEWRDQPLHFGHTETNKCVSEKRRNRKFCTQIFQSKQRVYGLTSVILKILTRYPLFCILLLLLPTSKAIISILIVGTIPREIKLGIINHEAKNWTRECYFPKYSESICELNLISCKFINELALNSSLVLEPYGMEIDALSQVRSGKLKGYILIPNNYSQHVINYAADKKFAPNETIEGSRIHVRLDQSDYVTGTFAIKYIFKSFLGYRKKFAVSCDLDAQKSYTFLNFREPVYGDTKDDYTSFMTPGLILIGFLALSNGITAMLLINDRKQGILNRQLVAGITIMDLMSSYLLAQTIIIGVQTLILGVVMKLVFDYMILGSLSLCWIICLLTGLCGTLLGIFLGIVCNDEVEVLFIEIFAYPILFSFGTAWPVEYIMTICKYLRYVLPTSLLTDSVRSVTIRGLGVMNPFVWPGIIVIVAWIVLSTFCCIVAFRLFCK